MTIFVANTNVLDLIGLKSAIEDTYINDATVTVTLKHKATDEEVAGQTWPTTMEYLVGTDGEYRAIIEHDVEFIANKDVIAYIEVDGGPERIGHWEFKFKPLTRTGATSDT